MASTLKQTTLSAAITVNQNTFSVASATDLSSPTNNFVQKIYVVDPGQMKGELMTVLSVAGTVVTVSRLDEFKSKHLSGALVIICPIDTSIGDPFVGVDPPSVPDAAPVLTWIINVVTGAQWLYSSVTSSWVPGFGNTTAPVSPTVAVASAAGLVTPSGPLFHITGALAITGFNAPLGFVSGVITVIPDGTFTWTTANNIALLGTAVVSKVITFTYDFGTSKWYPDNVS